MQTYTVSYRNALNGLRVPLNITSFIYLFILICRSMCKNGRSSHAEITLTVAQI